MKLSNRSIMCRIGTFPSTGILLVSCLLIQAALVHTAFGDSKEFVFAENGMAKAAIVVNPNAKPGYRIAANELATYLNKLTDARFTVVDKPIPGFGTIRIDDKYKAGKFEEVSIKVKDGKTVEVGGDGARGTLYAVYEMIEDFGVGFYAWDYEYLPPATNRLALAVGYEKKTAPFMVCRRVWSGPSWGNSEMNRDFNMKMRFHNNLREGFEDNLPSYAIGQLLTGHFISPNKFLNKDKNPDTYHPEWFASGEWRGQDRCPRWVCVSNEGMVTELLNEVEEDIIKETEKRPGEKIEISLGVTDGSMRCCCEKCLALIAEDEDAELPASSIQAIRLLNRVAKHFAKKYPHVRFNMLAYDSFGTTPTNVEKFRLEPNAGIAIAHLWRNHGRPIAANERTVLSVENWNKFTDNGIAHWDYYANFYSFIIPFPNYDIMGENWRYFKAHNIDRMDSQMQWTIYGDLADLHWWLYNKLSWNPDADDKALITKFLNGCYGAAAQEMQQYINVMLHARDRQRGLWSGCYVGDTRAYLTGEDCVKIYRLFEGAMRKTANDTQRQKMVKRARIAALLLAGTRYQDMVEPAKRQNWKMPSRESILEEFKLSCAQQTPCHKDYFFGEIQGGPQKAHAQMAGTEDAAVYPDHAERKVIYIGADGMKGGHRMSLTNDIDGTTFAHVDMSNITEELYGLLENPDNASAYYSTKEGEEGWWYGFSTFRTDCKVDDDPCAAYFTLWSPWDQEGHRWQAQAELAAMFVPGTKGDTNWHTHCLGKYLFVTNSQVNVFPGVVHRMNSYDVKNFVLVDSSLIDNEADTAHYIPWQKLRAQPGCRPERDYDGFTYSRQTASNGIIRLTVEDDHVGEWHVLARVRVGATKYLDTDVARLVLEIPAPRGSKDPSTIIAEARVGGSPYDDSWQIISLGKVKLEKGMTLTLKPSGKSPFRFLDFRNVNLLNLSVFEKP